MWETWTQLLASAGPKPSCCGHLQNMGNVSVSLPCKELDTIVPLPLHSAQPACTCTPVISQQPVRARILTPFPGRGWGDRGSARCRVDSQGRALGKGAQVQDCAKASVLVPLSGVLGCPPALGLRLHIYRPQQGAYSHPWLGWGTTVAPPPTTWQPQRLPGGTHRARLQGKTIPRRAHRGGQLGFCDLQCDTH